MPEPVKAAEYRVVASVLESIGFSETKTDSHVSFLHEASDTCILLPPSSVDSGISETDVASVRRHLDEKKLMSADDFNQRIASASSMPTSR